MKKCGLAIFLFVGLFFFNSHNVYAFRGQYTYDINTVSITDNAIQLTGWAAINEGNSTIHNINPTDVLTITGLDASGKTVYSKPYQNLASKPSYSNATDKPHDYTGAYFFKDKDGWSSYPLSGSKRAEAIADTLNTYSNRFYINIDFKFKILASDIKAAVTKGAVRINMTINISVSGGGTTVYGKYFSTNSASATIGVGIQDNRLDAKFYNSLAALLPDYKVTFRDTVSKVTNVAVQALARCDEGLSSRLRYDGSKLICAGNINTTSPLYYYDVNAGDKANYTVQGKPEYLVTTLVQNAKVYVYQAKVKVGGSCYSGHCVYDAPNEAVSTSVQTAYLPAFWLKPISGTTWIQVEPDGCSALPECSYDNLKKSTTTCSTDCCTKLCTDSLNKSTYFCVNKCGCLAKSECKSLGSTTTCPTSCCNQMCTDPLNESTYFCTTKCDNSSGSDSVPCENIEDAQEKYCCQYPKASSCSSGGYPKPDDPIPTTDDEPVTKDGTCDSSEQTKINFKYPGTGWGKTLVSNTACKISCQETMQVTFNPQQSVRAGMGWVYPIKVDSSRYCTVAYSNDKWTKNLNDNSKNANDNYKNMNDSLSAAKKLDNDCGTKDEDVKAPSCLGGYTRNKGECTKGTFTTSACPPDYDYSSSGDKCINPVCSNSRKDWDLAQADIKSEINDATNYRNLYNSYVTAINQLNSERNTCNNYISNIPYTGAASATITSANVPSQTEYEITSKTYSEDTAYENSLPSKTTDYSINECDDTTINDPLFVGDYKWEASSFSASYCNYKPATKKYADFTNKKSDASLVFEFSDAYYVQRYTGKLSLTDEDGYDFDGRNSYTDFYEVSASNDFDVTATDLGPNLPGVSKLWTIDPFTCQYNVDNLIFPPKGDTNYDKYGNVAFMYRQIFLTSPFPNRLAGENWRGNEYLITSKGYSVYGQNALYSMTLNPLIMQTIRTYLDTHEGYTSFNVNNPYKSDLLNQLGIKRKR